MKIIDSNVVYITPLNEAAIMERLELAGRVCYKSEGRIEEGSAEKFIRGIIKRGHESVLEHCSLTVKFVCDRAVANEIVRHRIASYSQESTRYCNYSHEDFGSQITVVKPTTLNVLSPEFQIWKRAIKTAETAYFDLLDCGMPPQIARAVLPNCLKTELVCTMNIREWRHFFRLRCAKAAHPDCRRVALLCLRQFAFGLPVLFGDLWEEFKEENI